MLAFHFFTVASETRLGLSCTVTGSSHAPRVFICLLWAFEWSR